MIDHWGGEHLPNTDYDKAFQAMDMPGKFSELVTFAGLWRLPNDVGMHLELMGWKPGALSDPNAANDPCYTQRGMVRLCLLINNFDSALADLKKREVPVLIDEVQMYLRWGDTKWTFFTDPDHNFLCFESWYPTRYWGERF